jgi:signal transduction histidine kinase
MARVLLVDDDELDRLAVRRALNASGVSVLITECATADQAMAAVAERSYACVLLDYLLPGTTALELLPQLMPKLGGAPVLVLTSHGDERVAVELMKAGVSDYLSKDRLDGTVLKRALGQALSLAAARRQLERSERAQRVYLARLRGLVEITPALYGVLTIAERVRVAVQSAHALFGAEESFLGLFEPQLELCTRGEEPHQLGAEDPNGWHALLERVRTTRSMRHIIEPRPMGAHLYAAVLESGERVMGVLALRLPSVPIAFTELTESLFVQLADMVSVALENARLYEATQRAVSARDAVVAVVSHDLRSPLNSFRIGVELLRSGEGAQTNAPVLVRMERAVLQMNRLIDDLLDVSRIERGELQVTPASFAISSLVEDIAAVHGPLANAANIKLELPTARDLIVVADRYRVMQLVGNLLSNALKSTPPGGTVTFAVDPQANGDLSFTVRDSGPGVPLEQRPRVFERYYRQGGRGLGLGLYIAKAIVEAHGGRIWIDDAPGGGAAFHFTLRR